MDTRLGTYGGGNGGAGSANPPTSGVNGTGGGGGGAGGDGNAVGARGGNGIVIVRYMGDTDLLVGGVYSTYSDGGNTYHVHTFTTGGDLVVQDVPEPATWALLLTAAFGCLVFRRRR